MTGVRERVVIIGYGAIGRTLHRLVDGLAGARVVGLVTTARSVASDDGSPHMPRFTSVRAALACEPTLFVECGGHSALAEHGEAALRAGADLLAASVGALADPGLEAGLRAVAAQTGRQVLIAAGALGGLDVLGAARHAGLDRVRYASEKAPAAWRHSPAERLVDLHAIREPTVFFRGSARDAARLFPQNANVAAAVALAGIGFERTEVRLAASPDAVGNTHRIQAEGPFGRIDVAVQGRPLADNPRTSMLAPMSLVRAIESRQAALRVI